MLAFRSHYGFNLVVVHRVAVKQQLTIDLQEKDLDEIGTLPAQKETTNQYDICDWRFFTDDEKALRK